MSKLSTLLPVPETSGEIEVKPSLFLSVFSSKEEVEASLIDGNTLVDCDKTSAVADDVKAVLASVVSETALSDEIPCSAVWEAKLDVDVDCPTMCE